MRSIFLILLASMVAIPPAAAGIRDLIVLPDGRTVYFRMKTGLATDTWYVAREAHSPAITIAAVQNNVVDVSGDGRFIVTAFLGDKICSFGGSSCFVQPNCQAFANVYTSGDGYRTAATQRETFLELDRSGQLIWIEHGRNCPGFISPGLELQGFYDPQTLQPVAAIGYRLANRGIGRRMITDRKEALVRFYEGRLGWWSARGILRQIGNSKEPDEVVTDATGCNVVYTPMDGTGILWIGLCGRYEPFEDRLGLHGTSLALSDNGRYLAFLNADDGRLLVYDRARRTVSRDLISDPVQAFAIGGTALYAVTTHNDMQRLDLDSGQVVQILPPMPELDAASPQQPLQLACPLICYGPVEPRLLVSTGMTIGLEGRNLDQPGWLVQLGQRIIPLTVQSPMSASFVYQDTGETNTTATIFHSGYPGIKLSLLLTAVPASP